jgi:hypothetical protein
MVEGREGVNAGRGPGLRPLENSTPELHASEAVHKARRKRRAPHASRRRLMT